MLPPLPLALYLRLASSAVFFAAVVLAAAGNRSLLMVPILAAASTVAHWLAARIAGSPLGQLPGISAQRISLYRQNMARAGFMVGLVGYGLTFMVVVFLSALAGSAELARSLNSTDANLVVIPTVIALLIGAARRLLPAPQMDVVRTETSYRGFEDEDDGIIIEGEVIHEDRSNS